MLEATTRSIRHIVYDRKYWCLFFLFLAINFFVVHRSLAEPGLILAGDFTRPEDFSRFVSSTLYPMWSEDRQGSNLPSVAQLGLYAPAIIVSSVIDIPSTVVYLIYFLVLGSLSGVFIFKLAEYVMARQNLTPRFEFALAASLFFIFGTYVVETTFHPAIAFSFYLSPLLLYALIRGIEEDRIRYLLLASLIYSLMAVTLHFVVFGFIIILSYILYDLLYRIIIQKFRSLPALKRSAWYTLLVLGPFIALSSFWLVPSITSSAFSLYPNLLTEDDPEVLYRNADIFHIFSVKGFFRLHEVYPFTESELAYINILSMTLTVIAVSSLLLYKENNKILIYLAILLVLSVIISVTPHYLPDLYNWFIFNIPGSSIYSWVFRSPKFYHFMSISIAVMLSLTGLRLYQIFYRQKKQLAKVVPPIFIAIVVVFSLVPNNILLTGDFKGHHRSYKLPGDYTNLLAYLEKQDDKNYKSIWGPPYAGLGSASWTTNWIGNLQKGISPTNAFSNSVTTLSQYINPLLFGIRFHYESSMLYDEQTINLNEFLSPINVKYVILHNDIPTLKDRIDGLSTALDKQKGLLKSKQFGFVTLYTITNPAEQVSTKQRTMLIQGGGLLKFDSVFQEEGVNNSNSNIAEEALSNSIGVFFSDISLDQNPKMWNSSDTLIAEKELSYSEYMLNKSDVFVISPSAYTDRFAPLRFWSISSADAPSFLNQLKRSGIELPYQFDYGKNIVFTSAKNSQLAIPVFVPEAGEYKVLSRYFANDKGGLLDFDIGGKSLTLGTKSHLNRFVWTDLGTLSLSEEGTKTLSIKNRNGFNALNLMALIPAEKYELYKAEFLNSLRDKDILYILEGESDFNIDGTPSRAVRDIDNYSNGKGLELRRTQDIASTKFEILKDGMYNLAIYGEGTITVDIDKGITRRTINLVEDGGGAHIEPVALNSGNHYIEITSAANRTNFSYLDSMTIDLIKNDDGHSSSLDQRQGEQPSEEATIQYHKINPTNYEVSVKAESPFMLAFAEAFDERWTAEVEETSTGIKKIYKPLPLYGVINGFRIDTEGEYVVHIKYTPQETFYVGATTSAVAYAFVIAYLIRGHHLIFPRGRTNLR